MGYQVTKHFSMHNAEQFREGFDEAAATRMFVYFGRVSPWNPADTSPQLFDNVEITDYQTWNFIDVLKKAQSSDVSLATGRTNWSNNQLFAEWDSNTTQMYSNNYYVLTDDNNVYKCLYNHREANSTIKPTGTSSAILNTGDDYVWKFMYNISGAERLKFVTATDIPVKSISANAGSAQWTVQQGAVNGAIEAIDVVNLGDSYQGVISNIVTANSTTIGVNSQAHATDSIYVGSTAYISQGKGSGQLREIIGYTGAGRLLTVNTAFTVTPNTQSLVHIGPKITISGDGTGATAYANVVGQPTGTIGNTVSKITMVASGTGYSQANVLITANGGSGGHARALMPPHGGHGSNAASELFGASIIVNVRFNGDESNTIFADNDFRITG